MKILHIGQMIGGLDVYIRNSILFSKEDNNYVIVSGLGDGNRPVSRNAQIINEYKIRMYRSLNIIDDFVAVIQAVKLVRKEKPDIIHCHSAKGGMIGRLTGFLTQTKTIYTPHAFSFLSAQSSVLQYIYMLLERFTRFKSYLLACSESEKALAMEKVHYSPQRALVWQNAVPRSTKTSTICDGDYICFIGRPSYQKNTYFLLEVVDELRKIKPHCKVLLLGIGYHSPDLDGMKNRIIELGISDNFVMIPWSDHQEIINYISDALVYLTVSRYEGLPLSVLEAMSLGKAIVASDVVGNRDCVRDNYNGYLLPFDKKKFAQKIAFLIDNAEIRERMGSHSLQLFKKNFLIENRIGVLDEIYKTVCHV